MDKIVEKHVEKKIALNSGYYDYRPLEHWQVVVAHFGARARASESDAMRMLFDLVKQVSTSCMSVDFHPTVIDDSLYLSRAPLTSNASHKERLCIASMSAHHVAVSFFASGSDAPQVGIYSRENAFPALDKILNGMRP